MSELQRRANPPTRSGNLSRSSDPTGLKAPVEDPAAPPRQGSVLFVCTANICRSPAAEAIARDRFGEGDLVFSSAGFLEDGRPMEPDMAKALAAKLGVEGAQGDSRVINADLLDAADIVLTMEARHIQNIVIEHPAVFPKVLPLREAAELVDRYRIQGIDALLAKLEGRDPLRYLDRRWDVDDPYRRGRRAYRRSALELGELVEKVVGALRPPR